MYKVDLNSDLGESFGRYTIGNDDKIIPLISSANKTPPAAIPPPLDLCTLPTKVRSCPCCKGA